MFRIRIAFTPIWCMGLFSVLDFSFAEDWNPRASIMDPWRWTELESLDSYQISRGVSASEGRLWFAHKEGLLSYDGFEVKDFAIDGFSSDRVIDFEAFSDDTICTLFRTWLVIFRAGEVEKIRLPKGNQFLEDHGLVEYRSGRMIVATKKGLREVRANELVPILGEDVFPDSILVDSEGRLWTSKNRSSDINVYNIVESGDDLKIEFHQRFARDGPQALAASFFLDSSEGVWVLDRGDEDVCYRYVDYVPETGVEGLDEAGLLDSDLWVAEEESGAMWFCVNRRMARLAEGVLEFCSFEEVPIPSSYPYVIPIDGSRIVIGGVHLNPYLLDLSSSRWETYEGLNFQCEDEGGTQWFLSLDRRIVSRTGSDWKAHSGEGLIDAPNRLILGPDQTVWASGSNKGVAAVSYLEEDHWNLLEYPKIGAIISHLGVLNTSDGSLIFGNGTAKYRLGDAEGGALVVRKRNGAYAGQRFPPPSFSVRASNIVEQEEEGLLFGSGRVYRGRGNGLLAAEPLDLVNHQWIDHMIVDRRGDLWIACFGVGIYRRSGEETILYGRSEGLPTKGAIFLLEDVSGDGVLVLTDMGFYRFDGESWSPFESFKGYTFRRESHTVFKDRSGGIWANFSSRSWLLENGAGDHSVKDGFRSVRYRLEADAPDTFASTSSLRFPEGSQIVVQFDGRDKWDLTPSRALSYSWSSDNGNWSRFLDQPSVTLDEFESGLQTLWVRARDRAGNIDATPAMVQFEILPPVWKRTWFVAFSAASLAAFASLLYMIFRYRIRAAVAIEEFKLDFFTNISHELRNPLAVIVAPVEMLMDSDIDSGIKRRLHVVLKNARKMQSMIDQLLQFRKLEKGRWTVTPTPGEVIGFAADAVRDFEPLWKSKSQRLELHAIVERCFCHFDASIYRKVIDNLVSNAIKYTGEEGKITIKLDVISDDIKTEFSLVVEDEGEGIPKHEHDNVLKPFYRLKRNQSEGGSGVGLALVQELVALCGGAIIVDSPIYDGGKGTRFSVTLPLDVSKEDQFESEGDESVEEMRGSRRSLLIVEDNEDMRKILTDSLHEEYVIHQAANGMEGFRKAKEFDPDLILSDVMMPQMDGLTMCERIKDDSEVSHIPIVLLTARNSMEHRIEGINMGADAYIAKPLNVGHLQACLRNLLESRRELRQKFAKQLVVEPSEVTVTPADELILRKAIRIVEERMLDPDFDVDRFASLMAMSRSTLKRKLKAVTGQSPQPFVQQMRMKRAAQLLGKPGVTISQVAERVGIYDLSYFSRLFKKKFGITASEYMSSKVESN